MKKLTTIVALAGVLATSAIASAREFKGYWVQGFGTHDRCNAETAYHGGYIPDDTVTGEQIGLVYFTWDGSDAHCLRRDSLTRDPTTTAVWNHGLEHEHNNLYDAVAELAMTGDDERMTADITQDILHTVALEYFQGPGESGNADKEELARSLSHAQIEKILSTYTKTVILEDYK